MTDPVAIPRMAPRVAPVAVGLGLWFLTQSLLRYRPDGTGIRGDGLHTLTARIHVFLLSKRCWADGLLIVSSLGIDVAGCFVLGYSVFGPSVRPFVGPMILFFAAGGPGAVRITCTEADDLADTGRAGPACAVRHDERPSVYRPYGAGRLRLVCRPWN
jgi:hypothetical protein